MALAVYAPGTRHHAGRRAGEVRWRPISPGFNTADLPALVDGRDVDYVLLARIDPARFRFQVRTAYADDVGLDQWMARLHPTLLVDGSYSGRQGWPATPVLSDGSPLGPQGYDARGHAFVSSPGSTGVHDLAYDRWEAAFQGAHDAMMSFPAAGGRRIAGDASKQVAGEPQLRRAGPGGADRHRHHHRAFFTLDRFARFLLEARIGLTLALNLDAGRSRARPSCWTGLSPGATVAGRRRSREHGLSC